MMENEVALHMPGRKTSKKQRDSEKNIESSCIPIRTENNIMNESQMHYYFVNFFVKKKLKNSRFL